MALKLVSQVRHPADFGDRRLVQRIEVLGLLIVIEAAWRESLSQLLFLLMVRLFHSSAERVLSTDLIEEDLDLFGGR